MSAVAMFGFDEASDLPMLAWLLPASAALHAAVMLLAPATQPRRPAPPAPVSIEVIAPPPPAAPAPVEPPAAPPRGPRAAGPASPGAQASRAPRPSGPRADGARPATAAPPIPALDEAPADFTGVVLSNAASTARGNLVGPAPAGGGSAVSGGPAVTSAERAPAPPRLVPVADLSRPPRAPALDEALERVYPAEARRVGVSGTAVLRVRIEPDGAVGAVRPVSESYPGFGEACARAVRSGRWGAPLDRAGRAVATEITYTCRFEVRS